MDPTPELIADLYAEKVRNARRQSPEQKLLAGAHLFEYVRTLAMAGIRLQFPDASPDQARAHFQRRLRISRQLDERP